MEGIYSKQKFFLVFVLFNMVATLVKGQGTRVSFYASSCPLAESIVSSAVQSHFQSDPSANGPKWEVPTGRRDGMVSLASDTDTLPGFSESIEEQKKKFAAFGLNTRDLVTLVVGNGADPSINPEFVSQLQTLCPPSSDDTGRVALDTDSVDSFDVSFFENLRNGRGILESDQMLWTDASTRSIAQSYLGVRGLRSLNFNIEFGRSMVKMSNIGVKTGTDGEIRKICSAIN
ncbi:hypothetical protein POUND7_016101 [Theobroma cacao]